VNHLALDTCVSFVQKWIVSTVKFYGSLVELSEKNNELKQQFTSLWIVLLHSHHIVKTTSAFAGLRILQTFSKLTDLHSNLWGYGNNTFSVQPKALAFQRKLFLWQRRMKSENLTEFPRHAYLVYENVTRTNGMPKHTPTLCNIWRRCQRNSYHATLHWKRPRVVEMGGSFRHLVGILSPKPQSRIIFKII